MIKADYVLSQPQTRAHHCHWPGCTRQVPPAMWGCKTHWFKLPKAIRDKIWRTFRPGQEKDWTPSSAYIQAAKEAQEWIDGARLCVCTSRSNELGHCCGWSATQPRSEER